MAYDRLVTFQGTVPPREEVGKALEDYLGGILAEGVRWDEAGDRFFAVIQGTVTHPLRRLTTVPFSEGSERWIEVVFGNLTIDVLTRQQDELTNNIANGFAKLLARFWQGAYEEER